MEANVTIPFTTTAPGPFTLPHGLGMVPCTVIIEMTAAGIIWFQGQRYDVNNLYMMASDTGLTGFVTVFARCGC